MRVAYSRFSTIPISHIEATNRHYENRAFTILLYFIRVPSNHSLSEFGNYFQISENKSMANQDKCGKRNARHCRALEVERNRSVEKSA